MSLISAVQAVSWRCNNPSLGGASQPSSRLQRKLAHGERPLSRALLRRLDRQLVLGECSAQGARLLGSEILRLESLVLVELAKVFLLRLIDDGEHSRDRLAHVATAAATTKLVQAKCESFLIFVSILYSCLAHVATAAATTEQVQTKCFTITAS